MKNKFICEGKAQAILGKTRFADPRKFLLSHRPIPDPRKFLMTCNDNQPYLLTEDGEFQLALEDGTPILLE